MRTRTPRRSSPTRASCGYQKVLTAAQPRPELPEYSSLWAPLDTEWPKVATGKESLDKGIGNAQNAYVKLVPDFSK